MVSSARACGKMDLGTPNAVSRTSTRWCAIVATWWCCPATTVPVEYSKCSLPPRQRRRRDHRRAGGPARRGRRFGIVAVDEDDRVRDFQKPRCGRASPRRPGAASMGIYIFEADVLIKALEHDAANMDSSTTSRNIVRQSSAPGRSQLRFYDEELGILAGHRDADHLLRRQHGPMVARVRVPDADRHCAHVAGAAARFVRPRRRPLPQGTHLYAFERCIVSGSTVTANVSARTSGCTAPAIGTRGPDAGVRRGATSRSARHHRPRRRVPEALSSASIRWKIDAATVLRCGRRRGDSRRRAAGGDIDPHALELEAAATEAASLQPLVQPEPICTCRR